MNETDLNKKENIQVVTRFAPSPTGFLHIGGVRTALFAWLFARQNEGEFILRIEDTDKSREVEGSIEHIKKSLSWLGLDWDYGPEKPHDEWGSALQSDRLDVYKKYAKILLDKGLAYPDPYTAEEVQEFREKAQAEKRPFLMREHRPETFDEWDGTKPLRFKTPTIKRFEWTDAVRGSLSAGEDALDDFIIIKADGFPTYNFAHIVDDEEMAVTHVMRGEEFVSSTPKFLSLYEALEIPVPILVTLPPIMGPDGKKKLSKRDGAKDLLHYNEDGYLPAAMVNFLALIGWNPGGEDEIFSLDKLIEIFSLDKIQKSGGAFNEEKLRWMNKEYLSKQSDEFLVEYISDVWVAGASNRPDNAQLAKLAPVMLERVHNKVEIKEAIESGEYDWVFKSPEYETDLLKWKKDTSAEASLPRLEKVLPLIETADYLTVDTIKSAIWDYAEEEGRGEVLWPLRVALSGSERSPDPFTLAYVLGADEVVARVRSAIDKLS